MNSSGPLDRLREVQQLDLKLDELTAGEHDVPEALSSARGEQERINNALEDAEIELDGVEKNVRRLESDLAATKDQIARTKAEQDKNAFDPKAQVQYQNRLQQLEDRVTETEEGLAPLYERRTALEQTRQALRGQHRELRPRIGDLETQDEVRVSALREEARGIREQRDALAAGVDARLIKEYELMRKQKRGIGLVEVQGGRCSGCNMQLPVTVQQRATTGKLPAVKCPSCGRFLYKPA